MTSQPPRVLLVAKGLDHGGIERFVVDLAAALRASGLDASVVAINGRRAGLCATATALGVPVELLGGSDRIGVAGLRQLRRVSRSADLVHAHGPLIAVAARLVATCPVVSSMHSEPRTWRTLSRWAWRATARRDAATSAVSARLAPPGAKVRVIEHGVDHAAAARARVDREHTRSTLGVPADIPLACMVAAHRSVKNHPLALRALAATTTRVHLLMVGDGPLRQRNEQFANELGLGDRVTFTSARDDAMRVIAAADVLLVSSDSEGQPMVVREALVCGVPVVATDVGNVREVLPAAAGWVVEPGAVTAFATAIDQVLDPAAHAAAVASALATSVPDVHEMAAHYAAWYREVLS